MPLADVFYENLPWFVIHLPSAVPALKLSLTSRGMKNRMNRRLLAVSVASRQRLQAISGERDRIETAMRNDNVIVTDVGEPSYGRGAPRADPLSEKQKSKNLALDAVFSPSVRKYGVLRGFVAIQISVGALIHPLASNPPCRVGGSARHLLLYS